MNHKRLVVIDSNSVIHRAFHALPSLTTKEGDLVNAVYGFLLVFFKALKEFRPDYVAAVFDFPAPTFRHEKYKEYKAQRPSTPEQLCRQIPKIKEILRAFGVPIFEKQGFEADDLIGALVRAAEKKQAFPRLEIIILTGDTDLLQLVNPQTRVYILKKGAKDTILYDENLVGEKYLGLKPEQLLDLRALKGDPSDNIPGVRGVGEKTAIGLIKEYGNLENIYHNLPLIPGRVREKLILHKQDAFFSRELAKIDQNAPIDFNLEKCRWGNYKQAKIQKVLEELEFRSLIKKLPEIGCQGGLKAS